MKDLKVLNVEWFSGITGTIGIVKCIDTVTNEHKYYMGVGQEWNDEDDDIQRIISFGVKLNYNRMKNIFA